MLPIEGLFPVATNTSINVYQLASGKRSDSPIGDTDRLAMIEQLNAGNHIELVVDAITCGYGPGIRNANHFGPSAKALKEFAKTSPGRPVLRDHNDSTRSIIGSIIAGSVDRDGDDTLLRNEFRVVERDAVLAALDGRFNLFSIRWDPMGADNIDCSLCKAKISQCSHYPGDIEIVKGDSVVVEWVSQRAPALELSWVPIPAVSITRTVGIRSAMSALKGPRMEKRSDDDNELEMISKELGAEPTVTACLTAIKKLRDDASSAKEAMLNAKADAHVERLRLDGLLSTGSAREAAIRKAWMSGESGAADGLEAMFREGVAEKAKPITTPAQLAVIAMQTQVSQEVHQTKSKLSADEILANIPMSDKHRALLGKYPAVDVLRKNPDWLPVGIKIDDLE